MKLSPQNPAPLPTPGPLAPLSVENPSCEHGCKDVIESPQRPSSTWLWGLRPQMRLVWVGLLGLASLQAPPQVFAQDTAAGSSADAGTGASAGTGARVAPAKPGVRNPHVTGEVPLPAAGASSGPAEGSGDGAASPNGDAAAQPVGPAKAGVANPHATGQIPIGDSAPQAAPEPLTPGPGVVSGKLAHKGQVSRTLGGYEVRLFAFENQQKVGEWHVETGEDGGYSFKDLNTRTSVKYIVSALFQGVVYLGPTLTYTDGTSALTGDIEVYDSTFAPGPLELSTMHVIVEGDPSSGALRLTEVLNFNNPGDRTLVGGQESTTTLTLDLPAGFSNLEVLQGMMPNQVATGEKSIVFNGPFYPGSNQVVFSYDYQPNGALVFRRRMPIKAGSVDVFVKPDGPAILSPQFKKEEPFKIQDDTFEHFTAGAVAAGSGVTFQIGGTEGGNEAEQQSIPGNAIAGIVILAFALFTVAPFFRRNASVAAPVTASAATLQLAELIKKRDFHLAAVKDADFDFESEKLSQQDYESLRSEHKQAAIALIQEIAVLQGTASAPTEAPAPVTASPVTASPATASPVTASPVTAGPVTASLATASPVPAPVASVPTQAPTVASPVAVAAAPAASTSLKFCTSCGAPPQPGDKFCGACGAPLRATV